MNRIEQMRADWISEIKGIVTVANGYRTTIVEVHTTLKDMNSLGALINFTTGEPLPEISLLLGDEGMTPVDTQRQYWDSDLEVLLLGYCRREHGDALLHDLKRIVGNVSLKYSTMNNDRWFVAGKLPNFTVSRDMERLDEKIWESIGINVRILSQNVTFTN